MRGLGSGRLRCVGRVYSRRVSFGRPTAANLAVGLAIACEVLLVAVAVRSGGSTLAAIAVLLVAVSTVVIARLDPVRLVMALTCACVFWTAMEPLRVGPVRVRSALLVLALTLALLTQITDRIPALPWWIWALAGAVGVSTALAAAFPVSSHYLAHRFNEAGVAGLTAGSGGSGVRIVLTVLGMPAIVVVSSMYFKRAPIWIAIAYITGNTLSALAAYTDYLGVTSLSSSFGGCGVIDSRACGFADHPVVLTIGIVYATGMASWFLVQRRPAYRTFGAVTVVVLLLGTYASGTRGAELCSAFALAASVLLLPQFRRHLHNVVLALASTIAIILVFFPGFGHALLVKSRLVGSGSAAASNQGRIEAMLQGWHDFLHSPVYGIGMNVLLQAHNGYLQAMAAGGTIFLLAVVALQFGTLSAAVKLVKFDPFALALVVTALTRIGYDLLEGALVSAVSMVPPALVAGLLAQQRTPEARPLPVATLEPTVR